MQRQYEEKALVKSPELFKGTTVQQAQGFTTSVTTGITGGQEVANTGQIFGVELM